MASNPLKGDTYTWTTSDEINTLNRLGTLSDKRLNRKDLLYGAEDAYEKRVNWDKIDKEAVLKHLDKLWEAELEGGTNGNVS
uniref:Uncharacterized protein n=1 Tax=viral metagenome TaxID=1070528 RepID=A0A6H1Z6U8_9ZZZZ